MRIYLIRHGETASNAARIVQTPETPLSPRGVAQAERLASRLTSAGITDIWSSDLRRAVMTAEVLQTATGARLRLEPRLQERNYGDIRGRAYADLGVDILAADYEPPGGERWVDFHARVSAVWADIVTRLPSVRGNLAIITHGLVCASLVLHHLRVPAGIDVPRGWKNTAVTIVEDGPPWTVRLLNCTAHLDADTGADTAGRPVV